MARATETPLLGLLHEIPTIATSSERLGYDERVNSQPSPMALGFDPAFDAAILVSEGGVESSYLDGLTKETESLFVHEGVNVR